MFSKSLEPIQMSPRSGSTGACTHDVLHPVLTAPQLCEGCEGQMRPLRPKARQRSVDLNSQPEGALRGS